MTGISEHPPAFGSIGESGASGAFGAGSLHCSNCPTFYVYRCVFIRNKHHNYFFAGFCIFAFKFKNISFYNSFSAVFVYGSQRRNRFCYALSKQNISRYGCFSSAPAESGVSVTVVDHLEAARQSIINEAQNTLSEQGLSVDVRHIMLVADAVDRKSVV